MAVTSTYQAASYSSALYRKLDECNQALKEQEALFTKHTNLPVLTSYCMLDISFSSNWETNIVGIGTSEVKPEVTGVLLWGALPNLKTVDESYRAAAPSYGIYISELGLGRGGVGQQLVIRYYGSTNYWVNDYNEMKFETSAACDSAASLTKKFMESADKPVVVFCEEYRNGATLHVTNFEDLLKPVRIFKAHRLSRQYPTYSECESGLQTLPTASGAFGAVCAGTAKDYRVHLFSRP